MGLSGRKIQEPVHGVMARQEGTQEALMLLIMHLTEHLTHGEGPGQEEMALANTQKRSSLKRQFIRDGAGIKGRPRGKALEG